MKGHTHKQHIIKDDISNPHFSMAKSVWGDLRPKDIKTDKHQEANSMMQKKKKKAEPPDNMFIILHARLPLQIWLYFVVV